MKKRTSPIPKRTPEEYAKRNYVDSQEEWHTGVSVPMPPEVHQEAFLSRKECAALLQVSLPTLNRYIRDEGLPNLAKNPKAATRKHLIFIRSEVEAWAKSQLSGLGRWK